MAKIAKIWSREILDSRSVPTIETACQLDTGHIAIASVPSGTSEGTHEALELRDKDPARYFGMGVLKAVANVNTILGPAVYGMDPTNLVEIDRKLIAQDGTGNKSKLGSNSILSVSVAVSKVAAIVGNLSPYMWVNKFSTALGLKSTIHLPTPLFNMINGGLHGAGNLDFQEFWVIPASSKKYQEALRLGSEVYHAIGKGLERKGAIHSVGHEGGYAPNLFTNTDAFEIILESIKETEYSIGRDLFLGLDVAASSFHKDNLYTIRDRSSPLTEASLIEYYKELVGNFNIALIEDPLSEDSWDGWKALYEILSGQVVIIGDDLLATNPNRVQKAISEKACNAILVKIDQIGTVSEAIEVIKLARSAGWKVIVSHRSGETNDWFAADFAVGVGADYVKFGAPARGERVAKYNRLSSIALEVGHV